MTQEALKLALEALEKNNNDWKRLADSGDTGRWTAEETELYKQTEQAITAIKEALAQPYQEPVAYGTWDTMLGKGHRMMMVRLDKGQDGCTVPLYTTPSQRKPLTDEEIDCLWSQSLADTEGETWLPLREFARAIEAAHGIKE